MILLVHVTVGEGHCIVQAVKEVNFVEPRPVCRKRKGILSLICLHKGDCRLAIGGDGEHHLLRVGGSDEELPIDVEGLQISCINECK